MSYETTNLYKLYYLFTRKIYRIQDVDIDKNLLYNKSKINLWDFVNTKCENLDGSFFTDFIQFDNKQAETNKRLALIAPGR